MSRMSKEQLVELVINLLVEISKTPSSAVYALRPEITMGVHKSQHLRYIFRKVNGVVQFEVINGGSPFHVDVYKLPDSLEEQASKLLNVL